jgi:ATP-dependent RNA helicase RhlE
MKFEELGLAEPLLRAIAAAGYNTCTPIQSQAIGPLVQGRDLVGLAQTGTGKTAAFALPVLHRLLLPESKVKPKHGSRRPTRALVLSPTRELALQTLDKFKTYGKGTSLRAAAILGGVNQNPQVRALDHGVDILVATPGRLLDLMNQGFVDLSSIQVMVLDEADRMLDMGFIPDVKRILAKLPESRQTLLFSATMPDDVKHLADAILRDPVRVRVAPVKETSQLIKQSVYLVAKGHKMQLLSHLLNKLPGSRTLVFTRTKHGADRIVKLLGRGRLRAEAIHGNKSQAARQRTLDNFKTNRVSILVATDIAARGIDVQGISHVLNFDLPETPETYVHRIGRTGRAGAEGVALSFCDSQERGYLKGIERLLKQALAVEKDHPTYTTEPAAEKNKASDSARIPAKVSQEHHVASQNRPPRPHSGDSAPLPAPRALNLRQAAGKNRTRRALVQ